ncbi:MAG: 6-phosphofructokinase [Planctomycetaceae bacterium]|nr:6-phosphofructokinase [Planctomycetaceae bacterium]
MKVALLTGGGDCPGLNPVIRGAVQTLTNAGHECVGLLEGWKGARDGDAIPLTPKVTDGIIDKGGTILFSSRTNLFKDAATEAKNVPILLESFKRLGIDALIAIGGDDTLGVARKLHDKYQLKTVGCPKTIDNDLCATDYTFGFDTSVNICMEAIDRCRTTAESHRRILVVETMGRHAGWIAAFAGIAGGADYILVPEENEHIEDVLTKMYATLNQRRADGKMWGIVVVSEGITLPDSVLKEVPPSVIRQTDEVDSFGHKQLGGIGEVIAELIKIKTGISTRAVVLGHMQRGGPPSAFDRVLGTRFGIHAARLVLNGDWGKMVALRGLDIVTVSLEEATGVNRALDMKFMDEAREFFK